jgi:hypothetical protein
MGTRRSLAPNMLLSAGPRPGQISEDILCTTRIQRERRIVRIGSNWTAICDRSRESEHVGMLDIELPDVADRPKWPTDGLEQIRLVRGLLAKAPAPTPPDAIASLLDGRNTAKRRDRIAEVLETLVAMAPIPAATATPVGPRILSTSPSRPTLFPRLSMRDFEDSLRSRRDD